MEILNHSSDQDGLLDILLTEIYTVWLNDVEQFCAYGCHTPEKDRSSSTFELLAQGSD
jgi:hypothetical protein